jgi:4-nitrophenyl phosphatase
LIFSKFLPAGEPNGRFDPIRRPNNLINGKFLFLFISFVQWQWTTQVAILHSRPVAFDFSAYEAVLLDLDGTLYKEDHPLPGAVALVRRFIGQGRKYACLSNSTESPHRIALRLQKMGLEVHPDLLYTAAASAVEYVLKQFPAPPRVFTLATLGIREMLEGRVVWTESELEPCDAVIVGNPACVDCSVPRLEIALRLIRQGAACMGICADRTYPSPRGLEIGSGATTMMLAYGANVEPIFFGKPQARFFQGLCDRLAVAPERCILVGDNLDSDINGAKGVNMKTILSLSGVTKRADLVGLPKERQPDWVVESLEEL